MYKEGSRRHRRGGGHRRRHGGVARTSNISL